MPGTRARARATTDLAVVTASGLLPDTVIGTPRAGQHGVEFVSESVDGVVVEDPVDHENEFVVGQQRPFPKGGRNGGRQAPSHIQSASLLTNVNATRWGAVRPGPEPTRIVLRQRRAAPPAGCRAA